MPETTPENRRRLGGTLDAGGSILDAEFWMLDSAVMGPKRRELRAQMGRAPMVKMSRMMPPTPVAAPWKGSTALGWLWDSILKAMARPSPISMMPAFSSPAPTRILDDWVGKVFSSGRVFL